jgi:hypothetical protein
LSESRPIFFGLEIPVCDAGLVLMQIFQDEDYFCGVQTRNLLVKAAEGSEMREELSTGDVVEKEVRRFVIGERGR